MRSFMSILPIFGAAYLLMSVSKQHMPYIAETVLIWLGILFAIFSIQSGNSRPQHYRFIGDWWLLIY